MENTRKHTCTITFQWDEGDERQIIDIWTPAKVSRNQVEQALKKAHKFLCFDDESDIYGDMGRTPETLVMYVCERKGWAWNEHQSDIMLTLD